MNFRFLCGNRGAAAMLCRTYQNAYGFLKKITNPERPIGDYTRARWRLPFDPPARRAVLRRRRQRDSSLWTPFHRLRAGRICPFICAASARQRDGGPKGRLRQVFPHVSIKKHHGFLWDTARRSRTVHRIAHDGFCICFVIGTARLPFGCCTHS